MRPPDPPSLLFIGSYRTDEAGRARRCDCCWVWIDGGVGRRRPRGDRRRVDARRYCELVTELLDSRDAAGIDAERIARESSGSPFFINGRSCGTSALPRESPRRAPSVYAAIGARVSRLPEPAARLLDVVALAGHPLAAGNAATTVAGLAPEDFSVLGVLRVGRLIRTRDTGDEEEVESYHDRIRETVVNRLSSDAKKDLHGRLAAVLEASGHADAETLAVHFQGSGNFDRAASYATAAAAQPTRHSPSSARHGSTGWPSSWNRSKGRRTARFA